MTDVIDLTAHLRKQRELNERIGECMAFMMIHGIQYPATDILRDIIANNAMTEEKVKAMEDSLKPTKPPCRLVTDDPVED